MSENNVVEFPAREEHEIHYVMEGDRIVGVTTPDWPFRIQRKDGKIAIVCQETDEAFGAVDADRFNVLLVAWLLADDPAIIDQAAMPPN